MTTNAVQTTESFDETFRALLDASNMVHRLRRIDADFATRMRAHVHLMHARVDVCKARAALT